MNEPAPDPGSFRDPGARVYMRDGAIFRAIMSQSAAAYLSAREIGLYDMLAEKGLLLPAREVAEQIDGAVHTLEHPVLPFISYPYEWSFALHKAAALLHLDLHIALLDEGFTLSDATAYNVQFRGSRPVFIDHMSLRPYVDGEIWAGHRQFCMQFLNPLLMWSRVGLAPNRWFRGALEGIEPEELAKLLPARAKFSWTVFTHVIAQAMLQRRSQNRKESARTQSASLPRTALVGMLTGLRRFIEGMHPPRATTVWADYAGNTSYSGEEAIAKREVVQAMTAAVKPSLMFDLGCNTGDYSQAALEAGAGYVVGFDLDFGALDAAYRRAQDADLPFLPLWMDAANPSPSQGWMQVERRGLNERAEAEALIGLAFVHHLAIGRNVPLPSVVEWIMSLAPVGVLEFVPKSDPMVQRMLAQRQDIFPDYTEDVFMQAVRARGRVVSTRHLSEQGRLLVWYDRRPGQL